jgi:prolyl-tRNA editing enzyme YbaK/EbsC (Cys-tRNA(Pro) deacylase)
VRKEPQKSGVKALIFFCDRNPILILVRGDHSADIKKVKRVTGAKKVRLATPEQVMNVCSCEIGSVHPLGRLMHVDRTIMDKTISENDRVNFSAGLHTHTINMNQIDFVRIAQPEIVDIAKE